LSSTGRSLQLKSKMVFDDLLQTSLKVNPGNSGGPLINMNGEMIGLMVASQDEAQGIGFAIPVSKIEKIISSWFSPERQSHAELGFDVVSEFSAEENLGYAIVKNVQAGKLNNLLGVKDGQKIKMVNKVPIRNAMDFYRYVKTKKVGEQLSITTIEGRKFFVQLFPLKGLTLAKSKLGLKFQRLGPDIARAISLPFDKGFVLSGFEADAGFAMFKVRRGDMLFKISNRIIMNDADFQDLLKDVKPGDRIPLVFLRVIPEGDTSHVETIHDAVIVQ
ncbi:MAG: trypsin-like serine protease, partial [Lentisphaeraceae bacterium]|nr:trypsin-like serine protease [Lentisphaeraceae bacterium]